MYYLTVSVRQGTVQLGGSVSESRSWMGLQLYEAPLGLEDLLPRWLTHMAVGKRSYFLCDCCRKPYLVPYNMGLSIGLLECSNNMTAGASP